MFEAFVKKLHERPEKFCLTVTGAGGSAIQSLLAVPGCSNTLLHAEVPYAASATNKLIGHTPQRYLSLQVSRQLAQRAYRQCGEILADGIGGAAPTPPCFGVGLSAAIGTNRDRKGEDAIYLTLWGKRCEAQDCPLIVDFTLILDKNLTRSEGETIATAIVLKAMGEASGLDFTTDDTFISKTLETLQVHRWANLVTNEGTVETQVHTETMRFENPIAAVLNNEVPFVIFNQHGDIRMKEAPYGPETFPHDQTINLLYPGSFRPLHWGHTELAKEAARVVKAASSSSLTTANKRVVLTFEISTTVVGKKDLDERDLCERIKQFTQSGLRVAITSRAKLFVEKAKLFPNHGFVVGVDTARRILDPVYYDSDMKQMVSAILEIKNLGCYFVVGGRKDLTQPDGWDELSRVTVPEELSDMFIGITANEFRVDISSTELRVLAEQRKRLTSQD